MNIYVAIDKVKRLLETRKIFTTEQSKEVIYSITELFQEYVRNNAIKMSSSDFDKNLTDYIYANIAKQIVHLYSSNSQYRVCKKLVMQINRTKMSLYTQLIPQRSYKTSFVRNLKFNLQHLTDKITTLQNMSQPAQRTEEWYQFRHNLLTASSIWKVFGTQSSINQIIYEKCEPYAVHKQASMDSPLHWGQKYEPISVELYSKLYNTKVADFGCIKHPKYPFIGASPDGINIAVNNPRYGRMLEIKNVVSRIITGIPKFEYWIQMQVQMETCDLNECDFLETKFIEYDSHNDFIQDGNFTHASDGKHKGIMILFSYVGIIHYEYAPLGISEADYDAWEEEAFKKNTDCEWIRTIYWKLEQYSNILVLRNKLWFEAAVPKIKEIWDTILKERIEGHQHRAPKKRKVSEMPKKCLIKIEKI